MSFRFSKDSIKNSLTLENIFELLQLWGGEPTYTSFGILSSTICHNPPGEGSRKLYYYSNSGLFKCYTGCDSYFDIFELYIKITSIQNNEDNDLNAAVIWIANYFGFSGEIIEDLKSVDWKYLDNYTRIQELEIGSNQFTLKPYDPIILDRFNYSIKIAPWLKDNISQKSIENNRIGFYPGGSQITIPHFDKDSNFIGLRGRALSDYEAETYGKYRPLKINGLLYTHPLGMNLYNLNNSKDNIKALRKAIIFESEKSCLQYQSYFDADISTACCGSSISQFQIQLLIDAGAQEIVVAFDRQFKQLGDEEFQKLKENFRRINERYKNFVNISFILDKKRILPYKASPTDEGPDKFLKLYKERITL